MNEPFGIPLSSALAHRRIAMFADMENLAIRSKETIPQLVNTPEWVGQSNTWIWSDQIHEILRMWGTVTRTYAFASAKGDSDGLRAVTEEMKKTSISLPEVFPRKGVRSKKVDIALSAQLLRQAFLGNFDTAVLLTGDGDFVPLVRAVQDMGKSVVILAFESGLSPDLRFAADECYLLDGLVKQRFRSIEVSLMNPGDQPNIAQAPKGSCKPDQFSQLSICIRRTGDSGPGARQAVVGADFGKAFFAGRLKLGGSEIVVGNRPGEQLVDQDVTLLETYPQLKISAAMRLRWAPGGSEMNEEDRSFSIRIAVADRTEIARFVVNPVT